MRALDVYLHDNIVGQILETRKGGRFQYASEIAQHFLGLPVLSLALPAKTRPFGEARTSNWFNGLLPEGRRREEICKNLNISPYDWIGLLAAIGWECAGAVKIRQQNDEPIPPAYYSTITASELGNRLYDISLHLTSAHNERFRMSLGGFQEKLCVAMPRLTNNPTVDPGDIVLPEGDAASTHILKPENENDYPGSAESEAWAMTAARNAARCSHVALLKLDNAPSTLVVERFDRAGDCWPNAVTRLHQEDACQALGLDSAEKYADPRSPKGSDPTYAAVAHLLTLYAKNPFNELEELLRQMVIDFALGNWDAHAKNTAFLYEEEMAPTLAPLYDVVPISEVEPRTNCLSMRIDGHILPDEIRVSSFVSEACRWGLQEATAKTIIDDCLERIVDGMRTASEIYPTAGKKHEQPALKRIDKLAH